MDFDTDPTTARGSRLALEHEFTVGGETFRLRNGLTGPQNDAIDPWRDVLKRLLAAEEDREEGWVKVEDDEFVATFRETMLVLLEPGQDVAFDRVLNNESSPLMIPDAFEICFWAVGQVVGRPTAASQPSSNGSTPLTTEPDAPSSTGDSSEPVEAASAP